MGNQSEAGSEFVESPEVLFEGASRRLVEAIDVVFVAWIERCVASRLPGDMADDRRRELLESAHEAGVEAKRVTLPQLITMLETDVDAQRANPLALIRPAVGYATAVLDEAGVPEVRRDEFEVRAFPGDRYDLSPARFDDIDESLHEVGLVWGAAKAHLVLTRRHAPPTH